MPREILRATKHLNKAGHGSVTFRPSKDKLQEVLRRAFRWVAEFVYDVTLAGIIPLLTVGTILLVGIVCLLFIGKYVGNWTLSIVLGASVTVLGVRAYRHTSAQRIGDLASRALRWFVAQWIANFWGDLLKSTASIGIAIADAALVLLLSPLILLAAFCDWVRFAPKRIVVALMVSAACIGFSLIAASFVISENKVRAVSHANAMEALSIDPANIIDIEYFENGTPKHIRRAINLPWYVEVLKTGGVALITFMAGFGSSYLKNRGALKELSVLRAKRDIEGTEFDERISRFGKLGTIVITLKKNKISIDELKSAWHTVTTESVASANALPQQITE
jgi:hypothetical protein